jgi:hypothetical protein
MHALTGKATEEALGLAKIQSIGSSPIKSLEKKRQLVQKREQPLGYEVQNSLKHYHLVMGFCVVVV